MLYTIRTFPVEYTLKDAEAFLLGIPWDSTETGRSVKHGPLFIREALRNIPGYDPETGRNPFECKWADAGDIEVVPGNWKLTKERILDTLTSAFTENSRLLPVTLGGDHLVTLALLEGLKARQPFTVVHLDAHADLSHDWVGEPFSHITWAFHAVELGFDIVQCGVRSWTPEEHDFMARNRKHIKKLDEVGGPVYLTIDLDVLDPSYAPDVGTPEPLGMEPAALFMLLKDICSRPLVGMDIVECASDSVGTQTAVLAAHIIKKVFCWHTTRFYA